MNFCNDKNKLTTFIDRSFKSTPHQDDEVVAEEDIFYSTEPMETVKKALKKSNQELLRLMVIKPRIEEIKARIDDLRQTI